MKKWMQKILENCKNNDDIFNKMSNNEYEEFRTLFENSDYDDIEEFSQQMIEEAKE